MTHEVTPAIQLQIVRLAAAGTTKALISKITGLSLWIIDHHYANEVEHATDLLAGSCLSRIAEEDEDWKASAWLLERVKPKLFGKNAQPDGGPQVTGTFLVKFVSPEKLVEKNKDISPKAQAEDDGEDDWEVDP